MAQSAQNIVSIQISLGICGSLYGNDTQPITLTAKFVPEPLFGSWSEEC